MDCLWFLAMCDFRFSFREKPKSQTSHLNGLMLPCVIMCSFSLSNRWNSRSQFMCSLNGHLNFFLALWLRLWRLSLSLRLNFAPHSLQEKGRSPLHTESPFDRHNSGYGKRFILGLPPDPIKKKGRGFTVLLTQVWWHYIEIYIMIRLTYYLLTD